MKNKIVVLLLVSLSLWFMVCSNDGPKKVCKVACSTAADCPSDLMCDTNGTQRCVQCVAAADCAYEEEGCDTVAGRCNKMCTVDDDCDIMTGKCSNAVCNGCASDADCGYLGSTEHRCGAQGACENSCKVDDDCWIGFSCNSGACSCDDAAACGNAFPNGNRTWVCE